MAKPRSPLLGAVFGDVRRLSLRLRVFLFFALLAAASVAAIAAAAYYGYRRLDPEAPASAFVTAALLGGFASVGLATWIWFLFDEHVAKPLVALASTLRSFAHADLRGEIDPQVARYLGDLAPAAAAVSAELARSREDLDAALKAEHERLLAEQERLVAILRDAPFGCFLCADDHRIALYNQRAIDHLGAYGEVGLGRSLLSVLNPAPILDALERLRRREAPDAATDLVCSTLDGSNSFQARMRLFRNPSDSGGRAGYLLTVRDVTEELRRLGAREALLRDVFDRLQRPAANLLSTIEALRTPAGTAPEARARLQSAVVDETRALTEAVSDLRERYAAEGPGWWPMADAPAGDILASVAARMTVSGIKVDVDAAPLTLRCDGYAIARLLGDLVEAQASRDGVEGLKITARAEREPRKHAGGEAGGEAAGGDEGDEAQIDICWRGPPAPIGEIDRLLDRALGDAYRGVTLRECLRRHGTDIWPETAGPGEARLRLPLAIAPRQAKAAAGPERTVFHDLRLLEATQRRDQPLLSELNLVIFDTETTGLEPHRGDEIVQIGAVRAVAGRLLSDDCFDMLVDPERSIPPTATAIHGVSNEDVAGAPCIDAAGRRFHQYCRDSVLVAHNALFDMAFLHRHADRIGARFDHPVLDTVLMSAILFGRSAPHDLDALSARLEVGLPEHARHTALGDAEATAAVALKMIAMLEQRGIATLDDYEREAAAHRAFLERGSTGAA